MDTERSGALTVQVRGWHLAIGVVALIVLAVAISERAAASAGRSSVPTQVIVSSGTASGAPAQGIDVTGVGEVFGTPDLLRLSLTVAVTQPSVRESMAGLASTVGAVTKALRGAGVEDKDVRTANLSVEPDYDYSGGSQRLRGYAASQDLSVTLRGLDRAGKAIAAATDAGGDRIRIGSAQLDLSDDSGLVQAARTEAFGAAKAKATAYAKAAGGSLGTVVLMQESSSSRPIPVDAYAEKARELGPVPIQAGQQAVSVTVRVVFSLA